MSTATSICRQIEQSILTGSLEAGSRVNENSLAGKYGVSRSVVRDALRLLEREGLVAFFENRGAVVRQPTVAEVLQLYDVRAGLSSTAARLAAANATTANIEELAELQRLMGELRDGDRESDYDQLNIAFHNLIFAASGNGRLIQMHDAVSKEMRLFVRRGVSGSGTMRQSFFEHETILHAIRAGDVARAASAFEAHVHSGKARMLEAMFAQVETETS